MKKQITHLYFFLPFLLLFTCGRPAPHDRKTIPPPESKTLPYEYFQLQRSYPDDHFPLKAYEKGLQEARQNAWPKNAGFDAAWTVQGPGNLGARVNTVAVHPENENILFAGFSSGGVWRTTNGGANWEPVFDDQLWPSIGDIVFDPSNPSTVYVATGDPNISFYPMLGDGVYKSTDNGNTWTNIGLGQNRVIPEIIVHPNQPDILFAASMGLPFVRDNNRGLYRTKDGGNTWKQVLFISDSTGVIDLEMDPFNPDIIYASTWDRVRNNNVSITTGHGAGIYKSTDGGDNWTLLQGGLPTGVLGRTGLAHSHLTPGLVYCLFVGSDQGLFGIYRSSDAGLNWEALDIGSLQNELGGFGWYFGKLRTHPFNDEELFLLDVALWRGNVESGSWQLATPEWWLYEVHADKHDLTFGNSGNMYLATDGGLYRSTDLGQSWTDIENIPTTQFYRVAFNPHQPDWYYGGAQDNGTTGGHAGMITSWPRIYGGDGFRPVFHPLDPNLFYCEAQHGGIVVTDDGGNSFYPATDGIDPQDRRDWDMPYLMSAHNPNVLYAATYRVYKSDAGPTPFFYPISESLTGPVTLHPRYHTITTLSESPLQAGLLYAATVDAHVWRTDNDGANWIEIDSQLPGRYVTEIKASPFYTDWVYITHSGYKDNEFIPRIHRSKNRGEDWEDISSDLPNIAINDVYILPGHADSILFVATDAGVYASMDAGGSWGRLGTNMPYVPSFDLDRNPAHNTLIAGTFARSIMTYPIDSLLPDTPVATNGVVAPNSRLEVYPNPASHTLHIVWNGQPPNKTIDMAVMGTKGKAWRYNQSGTQWDVDVSALPAGIYFIKAQSGSVVQHGRFLKK